MLRASIRTRQFGFFQQFHHVQHVVRQPVRQFVFQQGDISRALFHALCKHVGDQRAVRIVLRVNRLVFPVDDVAAVMLAHLAPGRNLDDERKAICQRGIKWFGPNVVLAEMICWIIWRGRIHRGPAVLQLFQPDAGDTPFVNDGKQLILKVGPAPGNFVKKDKLSVPDCAGRGDKMQGFSIFIRQRNTYQIIIIDKGGVVMPPCQPKRISEALDQQRFGCAMRPDQHERGLCGEGSQNHRVQMLPALNPQRTDNFHASRWQVNHDGLS